ncbi:MAG: hypothetical protein ACRENP_08810 [Longimicrobiales bacterium]
MSIGRSGLIRSIVLGVLTLNLLGVQVGIEPSHACPVHDRDVQQAAGPSHAGHHPVNGDDSASSPEEPNCCTCLGTCAVAAPALLAGRIVPSWLSLESTARTRVVHTDVRQHPLPRLHPFATAPPLS